MVNTIHAGSYDGGVGEGWRDAAVLAGGNYMSIDHNHQIAHIVAPQDKRIAELNAKLNDTYIPYGAAGQKSAMRQSQQDEQSNSISLGLLSKRAKSKASRMYDNSAWDLVDAEAKKSVKIEELDKEQLPEELQAMSLEEVKTHVKKMARKRADLKREILELHSQREEHVKKEQGKSGEKDASTLKKAITKAVREQGEAKGYEFDVAEK